jgi:hypothetical protein
MGRGDAVIAAVFAGWFLLVLLRQLGLGRAFVRRLDVFQLVPGWRLFSGFAGHHDYSIHVRNIDAATPEWHRLEGGPRPVRSALWHPALLLVRVRRSQAISVVSAYRQDKEVTGSPRYRALVGSLSTLPQLQLAQRFQFRIVAERPYDPTFEAMEVYRSPVEAVRTF